MANQNRTAAGAQSKRAGAQWERHVETYWLEPLRRAGYLLCWHKLEPRKAGAIYLAKAGADYVACRLGGDYVAIEAKQTKHARFARREVSDVQIAHLETVEHSYLALLLDGRLFLMPWRQVPWVTVRSAQTIRAQDCARWEIHDLYDVQRIIG